MKINTDKLKKVIVKSLSTFKKPYNNWLVQTLFGTTSQKQFEIATRIKNFLENGCDKEEDILRTTWAILNSDTTVVKTVANAIYEQRESLFEDEDVKELECIIVDVKNNNIEMAAGISSGCDPEKFIKPIRDFLKSEIQEVAKDEKEFDGYMKDLIRQFNLGEEIAMKPKIFGVDNG